MRRCMRDRGRTCLPEGTQCQKETCCPCCRRCFQLTFDDVAMKCEQFHCKCPTPRDCLPRKCACPNPLELCARCRCPDADCFTSCFDKCKCTLPGCPSCECPKCPTFSCPSCKCPSIKCPTCKCPACTCPTCPACSLPECDIQCQLPDLTLCLQCLLCVRVERAPAGAGDARGAVEEV